MHRAILTALAVQSSAALWMHAVPIDCARFGGQIGEIHPTYIPRPPAYGRFWRHLAAWARRRNE
jgi:hypothetical protein